MTAVRRKSLWGWEKEKEAYGWHPNDRMDKMEECGKAGAKSVMVVNVGILSLGIADTIKTSCYPPVAMVGCCSKQYPKKDLFGNPCFMQYIFPFEVSSLHTGKRFFT